MGAKFILLGVFLVASACAQYCSPGPTTTVDGNLGKVIAQGDTRSFTDVTDCPGYIGARDLTSLWIDLHVGGQYTLQFNVTTCGNLFPTVSGAWIDFDQNGSFDPTEVLFPFNRSSGWITANFVVNPSTPVKSGMTRMRLEVQETSSPNPLDPCSRFAYGGTKDFNVSIGGSGPRCDSGPTTTQDANLGPVSLQGASTAISDQSNCPGQIGPIDLTQQSADIFPGSTYVLSYTISTCGAIYPSVAAAWIDYNGDNSLDDWERIVPFSSQYGLNSVSFRAATTNATANRTVIFGKTWLRVQVQETNAPSIIPCVKFAFGGTKDFAINIALAYCNSGPTATGGSVLGSVFLQGVSTKIDNTSSCPSGIGPQDVTSQSADLLPGAPYVLNYEVVSCGDPGSSGSASWIDYNQNALFEQWEQITPFSTTNGKNTFSFKVPPSTPDQQVKPGTTRLRVQIQADSSAPLNACATFVKGETKDFTIKILTN